MRENVVKKHETKKKENKMKNKISIKQKLALALLLVGGSAVFATIIAACKNEPVDDKPKTKPTLTGSVNIGGTMEVGETLTANITDSNSTAGKFTYKWTRTPNGGQALEITGANGATYVIAESDLEHTLGAIIENEDTQGKISSMSASKAGLANTTARNFNDQTMFVDGGRNYLADIVDERTGARYKTLQQLGVVTKLQDAVTAAFDGASNPNKSRFRAVFNIEANTKGKVKITIENGVEYLSYEVDDSANIRFNLEYLLTVSDADLQSAITTAVVEMRGLIIVLDRAATNDSVRMAGVPVPQYNRAMQLRDNRIAGRMVRQRMG